jgi:hypothetical protein
MCAQLDLEVICKIPQKKRCHFEVKFIVKNTPKKKKKKKTFMFKSYYLMDPME